VNCLVNWRVSQTCTALFRNYEFRIILISQFAED